MQTVFMIRGLCTLKYVTIVVNERREKIKALIKEKHANGFNKWYNKINKFKQERFRRSRF
jgi:hypothetical protein